MAGEHTGGSCLHLYFPPVLGDSEKNLKGNQNIGRKKEENFKVILMFLFYFIFILFFKTGFLWSPGSPETSSVDQVARTQLSTSLSLSSAGMQLHFLALWSYVQWILFCCTWIWIQFFTDGSQTLFRATSPAPFAVRFQLTCSDWLWACSVSQDSLHLNFFCPGFLSSWDYRPATPGL